MPSSRSREDRRRRRAAALGVRPSEPRQSGDPPMGALGEPGEISGRLRTQVDELIGELEGLLRKHDPLDLIAPIATWTQVTWMGEERPIGDAAGYRPPFQQADLEYAISFALALPESAAPEPVTPAAIKRFGELLEELRLKAPLHGMIGAGMAQSEPRAFELQGMMRDWTTSVRGDNYWSVERRICEGLFAGAENFMLEKFRFGPRDVIRFADRVTKVIVERFRNAVEQVEDHLRGLTDTLSMLASMPEHQGKPAQDLLAALGPALHSAHAPDIERLPEKLGVVEKRDIFEVVPIDETERRIVEQLALRAGENTAFLEKVPKWRGWPLGESLVRKRPLVYAGGRFYALAFATITQSLRTIIESLLEKADQAYFEKKYAPLRAKFLEHEVGQLMRTWFGSSNVYEHLYYSLSEDGVNKRCELDCLARFGDVLLLVEAKAGSLAPKARRGEFGRLESDFKDLVEDAHRQAERAMYYFRSTPRPKFTDTRGREVLVLDRGRTTRVVSVNVTLDNLSPIAPNVSRLFPPEDHATSALRWTVSLADLIVFQDILPSPTAFLHYLHRRDEMRRGPAVRCVDELDLLMFYLHQGLWIKESDFGPGKVMIVTIDGSFTRALDDYYARVANGLSGTKPGLKVPDELTQLLVAIDRSPRAAGPSLMSSLLDCADDAKRTTSEGIRDIEQKYEADEKPHTVSLGPIGECMILLACGRGLMAQEEARSWARRWLSKADVNVAYVSSWVYPLATAKPYTWRFTRNN